MSSSMPIRSRPQTRDARRRRAVALAPAAVALAPAAVTLALATSTFAEPAVTVDEMIVDGLTWVNIGPARGGRVQAVHGVVGDPMTYYMGATGGGVWKTNNAGASWSNITDGFLTTGSIGAIEVAPSDQNVIYVGAGEHDIRGNFSHGDGVYKSVDAGRTWTHVGLADTRQIGAIACDPRDEDVAYVAALGHIFGPNAERGVFKTTDGGDTWERILYVNDDTGAVDVQLDPFNPRVVYACFWEVSRTPWSLTSGGPGSSIWRSQDSGETWEELSNGLPEGITGKATIAPSAAQRDRVWAIVEAKDGGVFRSDDGGDSWRRVNSDAALRQRAWYYSHICADPQDADTVYVMNVRFWKSTDGGRTFSSIRVPHSDNHDIWIDPHDNQRMIEANDGGANVSFDGGRTWSRQDNQPTAQFYHVITDNNFPYRVLGAQQDNSTVSITSQNRRWGREDFHAVGGGESGYIAPRHDNPDIVYAGSYLGYLTRYDHDLGMSRNIQVWPENAIGDGPAPLRYRFQWTFPVVVSVHDPDVVYTAGNVVFRSTNEGHSWEAISPDLTTDDETRQQSSGGPITKDNTGVEYYCTIFALAESPLDANVLWAGSDDGLVHVTSDGGETWTDVTPPNLGDWPLISLIEASPHEVDTAYLAVNRYKMDDFTPYIYKTTDRGASWSLITDGIDDDDAFVRAVREDPAAPGLLYAGTETGVWYSANGGGHWAPLQSNLPVVPVTDLVVKEHDLVVATQGRSFWKLDDLSPLRQLASVDDDAAVHVFEIDDHWRKGWDPVKVRYLVNDDLGDKAELAIEFQHENGDVIRTIKGSAAPTAPGLHTVRWNQRHDSPTRVPGAVGWPGTPPGPMVPPGVYQVVVRLGDEVVAERGVTTHPDPRLETTEDEYEDLYEFQLEVHESVDRAHTAVNQIRSVRGQINDTLARAKRHGADDDLREPADALLAAMAEIEEAIIQTRSKSSQDPLNFPVRLNDKIGALARASGSETPPTEQVYDVFEYLSEKLDAELERLEDLLENEIPAFNEAVFDLQVPAIVLDDADDDETPTDPEEDEGGDR